MGSARANGLVKRRGSPSSYDLAVYPRLSVPSQRAAQAHAAVNLFDTNRPTIPAKEDIDIRRHLRISMKIYSVVIPGKAQPYSISCSVWMYEL